MWMIDPRFMCDRHLLGEHYECHMFAGCIKKNKTLTGYIANNLFDPASLTLRHNQLVNEMKNRKFLHRSPIDEYNGISSPINSCGSLQVLLKRCKVCNDKYTSISCGL
jgi:hypothetical protein